MLQRAVAIPFSFNNIVVQLDERVVAEPLKIANILML